MTSDLITSLRNARVKEAAQLRDARHRAQQGRFLIDGVRELAAALAAGVPLVEAFVCPALCQSAACQALLGELAARGVAVCRVAPPVFARLAYGERAEGVLGVALAQRRDLSAIRLPERPLVAVLEGVEKPGNFGAVLRSADAAGVSAVIVVEGGTDLYNPNAIRASLGTIFALRVVEATAAAALGWLREQGLAMYAARVDAAADYTAADLSRPAAIILGSEARGLSDAWRAHDVQAIRLPMAGTADSLNVSATAAVLFYEAVRQRATPRSIS